MSHKTIENLALASYENIFLNIKTDDGNSERIVNIPLTELYPPEFHPFYVNDDDAMNRLAENIKQNGILEPGLVRPRTEGGYELLCGNRRKRACEIARIEMLPVIIRELDDNSAVLAMVDSNLEQREKILPSERAWAYKIMMDALNHNGIKGESHSYEIMTKRTGITKNQLFRYIRLTNLIVTLLDKVDSHQLSLNPAVELSYLSQKEQATVAETMAKHDIKPSLSQAIRLKKLKQENNLTLDIINTILSEDKKLPKNETSGIQKFRKYFPPETSPKQMEKVIAELLTDWKKRSKAG